ncbi:MAG: lasso peptide [Candidatus Acidiferrales bacterium]
MDKGLKGVKKPYSSPVLTTYGTIRELTQMVGTRKHRDGGTFPNFRTHMK